MNSGDKTSYLNDCEELDLNVYLMVFWKWRSLIAGLVFLATFSAGFVTFYLPKTYRAEAILQIGNASLVDITTWMKSSSDIAAAVMEKMHFPEGMRPGDVMSSIDIKPVTSRDRTNVAESSNFLQVGCNWDDPQVAVRILQSLLDAVINDRAKIHAVSLQTLQAQAEALRIQLAKNQTRQARLRQGIRQAERQLEVNADYRDRLKSGMETISKTLSVTQEELSRLNKNSVAPVDILYLNSTYNAQAGRLMDLTRENFSMDTDDIKRKQDLLNMEAGQDDLVIQNENIKVGLAQLEEKIMFFKNANTKILASPESSGVPIRPRKRKIILAAFLVSSMTALAGSLLAEKFSQGSLLRVPKA